jgi:hypothetical protein
VRVLVNSLYIVLASAIGLWFGKLVGSPFLYSNIVRLVFHDCDMVPCLQQCRKKRYSRS